MRHYAAFTAPNRRNDTPRACKVSQNAAKSPVRSSITASPPESKGIVIRACSGRVAATRARFAIASIHIRRDASGGRFCTRSQFRANCMCRFTWEWSQWKDCFTHGMNRPCGSMAFAAMSRRPISARNFTAHSACSVLKSSKCRISRVIWSRFKPPYLALGEFAPSFWYSPIARTTAVKM